MNIYLTYQPCHFSGGHYRKSNNSCTESLIQYYNNVLKPYSISANIRFGYLYRAHWTESPKYVIMIKNAQEGIKLLREYFDLDIIS